MFRETKAFSGFSADDTDRARKSTPTPSTCGCPSSAVPVGC